MGAYNHWFPRFLAFLLGIRPEPLPEPKYLEQYLYPAISEDKLSEMAREKWQD